MSALRDPGGSLLFCIVFGVLATLVDGAVVGDQCDWSASGVGGSVTPVYVRCSQGRIAWSYPAGALRVLLRLGASGRQFRACVRPAPSLAGATLHLETGHALLPLYAPHQAASRLVRCFDSRDAQAALYLEAAPGTAPRRAAFDYDLQALPRGATRYDPSTGCRPCSREDMARAYCTSDLVARGIIRSVEEVEELEESVVHVRVTKELRSSYSGDEEEEDEKRSMNAVTSDQEEVLLRVGHECGVKRGVGEFVFMARRKLGQLALSCAPRLEDWVDVVNSENSRGSAHCVLSS